MQNIHGCVKIFVDGSAVHTVRSLARSLGQLDDFSNIPDEYIDQWTKGCKDIKVVPISFAKRHKDMLRTLMLWVSKRTLRIHPDLDDLIIGVRSSAAKGEYQLDKDKTSHDDDLVDGITFITMRSQVLATLFDL